MNATSTAHGRTTLLSFLAAVFLALSASTLAGPKSVAVKGSVEEVTEHVEPVADYRLETDIVGKAGIGGDRDSGSKRGQRATPPLQLEDEVPVQLGQELEARVLLRRHGVQHLQCDTQVGGDALGLVDHRVHHHVAGLVG